MQKKSCPEEMQIFLQGSFPCLLSVRCVKLGLVRSSPVPCFMGETSSNGEEGGQSNCLLNCIFACIRLYWSKSLRVCETHSGVRQLTSHTSFREWERLRISNEVIAIVPVSCLESFLFFIICKRRGLCDCFLILLLIQ